MGDTLTMNTIMKPRKLGELGENMACDYLRKKGIWCLLRYENDLLKN